MAFAHLVISAVLLVGQGPVAAAELDRQRAFELAHADQEPGDSLYRQARQLLNRNRYAEAAARFKEFREKNPNSERVADALYFEAFALYRGGDINQLREARARLREQETRFPRAATKSDSKTLRVRILQELAQRGDAEAAAQIRVLADSAAKAPAVPDTPEPPRAPRAPRPPRAGDRSGADCDSDDDDNVKMTALNALMQMDSERAIPILKSVLAKRDSGSVCLRRRAVFLVSQKRAPEATAILLDAARHDPDLDVRLQAVQWLSQVRSDDATAALDSILRTSRDTELQEKALFALSQIKSERATSSLRAYAERSDVPVAVRERAIFWLGQQRSPENAAFLRALYAKLQNSELKEKCLFSLSQMKDQGNDRWLLELAANDREPVEIRKRALFYAGQAGAPVADLTALYDRTRDREMKQQLIFVYSQRKDAQAVDKLMDIARRETDPELRKKAVFWLGQSRDPRAAQFLVELINQP
jgi:HEAT repeat protein